MQWTIFEADLEMINNPVYLSLCLSTSLLLGLAAFFFAHLPSDPDHPECRTWDVFLLQQAGAYASYAKCNLVHFLHFLHHDEQFHA
jgi:hypothetical protein